MHIYKSKYVILDTSTAAVPVVFAEFLTHSDVVRNLTGRTDAVLGAGFCYIQQTEDGPRYVCYGESVSLKMRSREEKDAFILNKYLGVVVDEL